MSSQLTQRDSLDTESELSPQEPPPSVIRWATEGSRFVALVSLDSYEIASRAGQILALRVGVKGDARIIVGGRTLIEYAFEPIRQLREST
jgi:hypothetical protein